MKQAGRFNKLLRAGYLVLIATFLYLPIGVLMLFSFNDSKSMGSWNGFTLSWYKEMFSNAELMEALGNTLTIALWAATAATLIGVLACIGLNAMSERKRNFFMMLNNIPLLNADIVTGISIMMSLLLFGISLNYGSVLFAHITFCIPYVILSVMPKFKQLENNAYEAALDLGASPAYAFFKVVLPDIMPGIVSGFLLSFTISVDDFVITHFTRGAGINTLSTLIYSQLKVGVRPTMFALSTIIFLLVFIILVISNFMTDTGKKKTSGWGRAKTIVIAVSLALVFGLAIKFTPATPGEILENGVIKVYSFGDYFDPELIEAFEEETGYSVIVDYFDTNEEMYPVIKNNTVQYDVVCCSDYMVEKLRDEGLIEKINKDNIPNIGNLTENVGSIMKNFDPEMNHSLPHTWGTFGIIYNKKYADEKDFSEPSWSVLWNEKYAGSIIMTSSMRDCFLPAAKLLGLSMNTTDESEMKEITNLLLDEKPLVYSYANDNTRDLMIGNNAAVAMINSGEAFYAISENENLDFVIPEEGTEVWVDCWAIPVGCENREGAEAWINFMLAEETAQINFEYLYYAIPNKGLYSEEFKEYAYEELELDDLEDNIMINPPEEVILKGECIKNLGHSADDMYSRYWKKLRSE